MSPDYHRDVVPPLFRAVDPSLNRADEPRVSGQNLEVYEALKSRGTLSNMDLAQITPRYGARIHDLRRAGVRIVTTPLHDGSGVVTYRLVSP